MAAAPVAGRARHRVRGGRLIPSVSLILPSRTAPRARRPDGGCAMTTRFKLFGACDMLAVDRSSESRLKVIAT